MRVVLFRLQMGALGVQYRLRHVGRQDQDYAGWQGTLIDKLTRTPGIRVESARPVGPL